MAAASNARRARVPSRLVNDRFASTVPVRVQSKAKLDELFVKWLNQATSKEIISGLIVGMPPGSPYRPASDSPKGNKTPPRPSLGRSGSSLEDLSRSSQARLTDISPYFKRSSQSLIRPKEKKTDHVIPTFYTVDKSLPADRIAEEMEATRVAFGGKDKKLNENQFRQVTATWGFSEFCNNAVFKRIDAAKLGYVTLEAATTFYNSFVKPKDMHQRFFDLMRKPENQYILPADFLPLLEEIIYTHPGLTFLTNSPEFQSRYVETVIARIFYKVNRSWTGRITVKELRCSNFLETLSLLDRENDINKILDYFSYEHFYVIYCKFWELDADHDLLISKDDLMKYDNHAVTFRLVDRVFCQAGKRFVSKDPRKMAYEDFIWFFLSEADKTSDTAVEYWFRCIDMDGDGRISMYEMEYFFEEQLHRMDCLSLESCMFEDVLCQLFDMIKPAQPDAITTLDIKRSRMAPLFFNALFNLNKFMTQEQKDPSQIRMEHATAALTDWDRYARGEYDRLAMEENDDDDEEEGRWGDSAKTHEAPF